ncbi:hypothetical protein AC249_AIPGENE17127 [Exaiptasia diaphana]|nr:hypothetical protein AC249_AIPGENE17127 [Exaiptasia diaphana]
MISGIAILPAMKSEAASEARQRFVGVLNDLRLYIKNMTNKFVMMMKNARKPRATQFATFYTGCKHVEIIENQTSSMLLIADPKIRHILIPDQNK